MPYLGHLPDVRAYLRRPLWRAEKGAHVRKTLEGANELIHAARELDDLQCKLHPELYFAELPEQVEQAKALCEGCPLQALCLQTALETREPWGVWGGEVFIGGQVVQDLVVAD